MAQRLSRLMAAWALLLALLAPLPAVAQADALVSALVSQLGVTEAQAAGGAGSIFRAGKSSMSAADYAGFASAVPGVDTLIGQAPAVSKSSGGLSGLLGSTGLAGGSGLGSLASLAGPFKSLGMSGDMVQRFLPVVLQYVQSTGGQQAMGLLQGALGL